MSKAIHIDTEKRIVIEIDLPDNDTKQRKAIGELLGYRKDARSNRLITPIGCLNKEGSIDRWGYGDSLYAPEHQGWADYSDDTGAFSLPGHDTPILGSGVITARSGVPMAVTVDQMKNLVQFHDGKDAADTITKLHEKMDRLHSKIYGNLKF